MSTDITVADILAGTKTFADVHPETCSNVDLRNFKASALTAHMEYNDRKLFAQSNPTRREQAAIDDMVTLAWGLAPDRSDVMELIRLGNAFAESDCSKM